MESARQLLKSDGFGDALLLVTAHPDDEVMFFAPALLCLGEEFTIYILCLSTGDYDGLGASQAGAHKGLCTTWNTS